LTFSIQEEAARLNQVVARFTIVEDAPEPTRRSSAVPVPRPMPPKRRLGRAAANAQGGEWKEF